MNTNIIRNAHGISAQELGVNPALQSVLDQFLDLPCHMTGWTWGAALDTAIEVAAEFGHTVEFENTPFGRFLASEIDGCPGLTWGGAIEMSLDNGTDVRLADNDAFARILADDGAELMDKSEANTFRLAPDGDIIVSKGWTYADAMDELLSIQREDRIFGTRRVH